MDERLIVLMGGVVAGTLSRLDNNLLRLAYDDTYRGSAGATPISVSLPLAIKTHSDTPAQRTVSNFLWGLLPDNDLVLTRWSQHYQVRSTSPFFLLGTPVGQDCAGAVTFCPPGDLDRHLSRRGSIEWLSVQQVADLLRDLRRDQTTWLGQDFAGHFSLAGAQAKTALVLSNGRWGRPSGATPTTHILKPKGASFADQDVNEHLCLAAAAKAGLVTVRSQIVTFGDETAIVVARYDRRRLRGGRVARVHQEDACQALGIHPASKYENAGGPGVADISRLIRRVMPPRDANRAVWRFADGLIWNWLIAGTDAHAKNYSLLLGGSQVRFAPLYDITSILPYIGQRLSDGVVLHERRLKMAMRIGGDYDLWPVRNPWVRAAKELGLQVDALLDRVRALATSAPSAFVAVASDSTAKQLQSPVTEQLVTRVRERSSRCLAVL